MGIDQVAHVTDIVKQALARRTERLKSSPKSKVQSPRSKAINQKSKIVGRLAELDRGNGHASPQTRNTEHETRKRHPAPLHSTLDTRHPTLPILQPLSSPFLEVNLRPNYIPDFATPRF